MKTLYIVAILILLFGCAQLQALTDSTAEKLGKAIKEYCQLPEETRMEFRANVDKNATPHSAAVTCRN